MKGTELLNSISEDRLEFTRHTTCDFHSLESEFHVNSMKSTAFMVMACSIEIQCDSLAIVDSSIFWAVSFPKN